jgi:hypothetical protein
MAYNSVEMHSIRYEMHYSKRNYNAKIQDLFYNKFINSKHYSKWTA